MNQEKYRNCGNRKTKLTIKVTEQHTNTHTRCMSEPPLLKYLVVIFVFNRYLGQDDNRWHTLFEYEEKGLELKKKNHTQFVK